LRRLAEVEEALSAGHDEELRGVAEGLQALGHAHRFLRERQRILGSVDEQDRGANVLGHVDG